MSTREKLLDVAGRLFAEHGFDGVSVRDITHTARVNLGAVTYHFGSKETLFGLALLQKVAPLQELGKRIEESREKPDARLRRALTEYTTFVLYKEPGLKALFTESLQGGERLPKDVVELLKYRDRLLSKIIREGVRDGIFRKCDARRTATMLLGLIIPYIQEQPLIDPRYRHGAYPREEVRKIVNAAVALVMKGLLVR